MIANLLGLSIALTPFEQHRLVVVAAYVLLIIAIAITLRTKKVSLGPKAVWIPLAVLSLSVFIAPNVTYACLIMLAMIGTYLACRIYGKRSFAILGPIVALGSVSTIVFSAIKGFEKTGGIYSDVNYNIAAGALLLGLLLWNHKYQWILTAIATVGLFFTGADEAAIVGVAITVVMIARKDWSKKTLLPISTLVIVLAICTPLGVTQKLWQTVPARVEAANNAIVATNEPEQQAATAEATGNRWDTYMTTLRDVKIRGHGYDPLNVKQTTIHNIPLRVMYELGPIAALAWLWLLGYGLFKTKLKYVFVAIGVFAMLDHFLWTQMSVYYWAVLGASTTATGSDLIFREEVTQ